MSPLLLRTLFSTLSPGGRSARLSILIFHRVLPESDPLFPDEIDIHRFRQICTSLRAWFNVLPLSVAVARLRSASLPPRAACITFDDGYADNFRCALPVLADQGLPATFFVATGFLDGGRMWNDTIIEAVRNTRIESLDLDDLGIGRLELSSIENRRNALTTTISAIKHLEPKARDEAVAKFRTRCATTAMPDDLMMTSDEVRSMRKSGMEIGAHTANHPILARCDQATARREIGESRSYLENLLDEPIGLFAYPNGKFGNDYTQDHADIVKELGFDAAVSTNSGTSAHGNDLYHLSRFTPWDRKTWKFGLRLAQNMTKKPVA